MATINISSMATPKVCLGNKSTIISETPRTTMVKFTRNPVWTQTRLGMVVVRAAPDKLSEKVEESIKNAQETCSENPESGECAAAWDEVEEVSAAASHARDRKKLDSDPLENYCKDNPETDECRTYDN